MKLVLATLIVLLSVPYQLQAASIDQEIKSCQAAWNKAKNKGYASALKLASQKKCPQTYEYLQWEKLRDEDIQSDFKDYTNFLAKHPNWPWMPVLLRKAEGSMPDNLPASEMIQWFSRNEPQTTWGMMLYLKTLKDAGDTKKLTIKAKSLWHNYDLNPKRQSEFLKLYGHLVNPDDHKRRVERLFNDQKLDQAKQVIPLLNKKDQPWAKARLALLEDHANPQAILSGVPEITSDLVYEHIRWHRRKDQLEGAHLINTLAPEATRDNQWWRERSYFAREAFNQGKPELAYQVMKNHPYSSGDKFAEAEWFCGWLALRFIKKPNEALTHFSNYKKNVNDAQSLAKAHYWLGRTYEILEQQENAKSEYRKASHYLSTYYGILSQNKLDKQVKFKYQTESKIDSNAWNKFQNHEFVRIARLLKAAKQEDKALPFLYMLGKRAKTQAEKRMAIELIQQVLKGYTIFAMRDIGFVENRILSWTYPMHQINDRARKQGVDTRLMMAIMRQESGFHTKAVSIAGASGMMQVMPATAEKIAKLNNYKHKKSCLTDDPNYNILLGSHFMKEMLDRYKGTYVLAIAAYNAGPKPIQKWIEQFGNPSDPNVDTVDWIESIPFKETRSYVKSVLANYYIYSALADKS